MLYYTIPVLLILLLFASWYKESRIFLFLFHKLVFAHQRGKPLFIDTNSHFPESITLEKNWELIRREISIASQAHRSFPRFHKVDPANHKISFDNTPAWRTIVIKAYDGWFMNNCELFPETYALLSQIPSVSTIMFSILEPGTNIPSHTGKFSGIYRYHLALSVPKSGQCYLEVAGENYFWKEGKGILFNDTYPHSVSNNTNEYRIVLFLDIKRKMSPVNNLINNIILHSIRISPVFKRAIKTGAISTG